MGILDAWLPVLYRLRKCNFNFICIIPKAGVASSIDMDNVLSKTANSIFDRVVFKTYSDDWASSDSLSSAKSLNSLTVIEIFILKLEVLLGRRRGLFLILLALKSLLRFVNRAKYRNKYCKLSDLTQNNSILLYDLDEEFKDYNEEIMSLLGSSVHKFSLAHGFGNIGLKEASHYKKNKGFVFNAEALLYSDVSRDYYLSYHSIGLENIKAVGSPKLERWWIDYIVSNSRPINDNDCVFLISRPSSEFLPKDTKKRIIKDIRKFVIDGMNSKLIIKKHPKEIIGDSLFEEILGVEDYGKTWEYSNQHPFSIGKKCLFAISFYSGVAIDMLAIGIPTIEYLDLKGLNGFDNNSSLRVDGEPVFNFRYCGLVLGVSNSTEFEKCLDEITNNRESVLEYLTMSFKNLFSYNDTSLSPTDIICSEIVKKASDER